jgi:serine/threonine protein kinase
MLARDGVAVQRTAQETAPRPRSPSGGGSLKPGHIMLTKSGAKLLDFGVAKMRAAEGVAGAAVGSLAEPITTVGTLMGTAQYMSPEQIQGHEADARSDLFALGATQRACAGASQFA